METSTKITTCIIIRCAISRRTLSRPVEERPSVRCARAVLSFRVFPQAGGGIVALEVNMRPPGGLTTDMFNYANDIDIYHEWANVVVNNRFDSRFSWPYYCGYIGRKSNKPYAHSHKEILARFGQRIVHHEPISGVFSAALGDYGYLVRSPDLDEIRR